MRTQSPKRQMRRFYLQNEDGTRIDMNDTKRLFFRNPTGLGMSKNLSFSTSGDGFFGTSESSKNQINPIGDIVFMSNPYKQYQEFVDYLTSAESLTLIYSPDAETEYYLDVELEYLTKTEIAGGVLSCPVSFKALSLWYRRVPKSYKITQAMPVSNPKTYPFTYSYAYSVEPDAARTLTAGGHIPAALEIWVKGELENPKLELRKKSNNALVGRTRLDGINTTANQWLRMSSKYNGGAGVTLGGSDVTSHINLTDNSFFRLPTNTPCILTISDENYATADVWVYVYEYFLTV